MPGLFHHEQGSWTMKRLLGLRVSVLFSLLLLPVVAAAKGKPGPCGHGEVFDSKILAVPVCPLTGVVVTAGVSEDLPKLETADWPTFLGSVAEPSSTIYMVEHAYRWWLIETDSEQWVIHTLVAISNPMARFNPPDMRPGHTVHLLRGPSGNCAARVNC